MTGRVCAVAGGKGGVGTTTTAINVGAAMEQFGHDTVVVDADLDMGDLGDLLGVDASVSVQALLGGETSLESALVDTDSGLTALPGENSLEAYADADPARLNDVLETLRESFDLVLVDTSSGVSHETTVPLGVADETLLVTRPSDPSLTDSALTVDLAARVDGTVAGGVITHATAETDVYAVGDRLDVPVLGAVPPDPAVTGEEPLLVNAVGSTAALCYSRLANRLTDCLFEGRDPSALEGEFHDEWFDEDGAVAVLADDDTGPDTGTDEEEDSARDDGDDAPYMSSMWMHDGY